MNWATSESPLGGMKTDTITIEGIEYAENDEQLNMLLSSGLPTTVEELEEAINREIKNRHKKDLKWIMRQITRDNHGGWNEDSTVIRCEIFREKTPAEIKQEERDKQNREAQAKTSKRNGLKRTLKALQEAGQGDSDAAEVLKKQIKELGGRI